MRFWMPIFFKRLFFNKKTKLAGFLQCVSQLTVEACLIQGTPQFAARTVMNHIRSITMKRLTLAISAIAPSATDLFYADSDMGLGECAGHAGDSDYCDSTFGLSVSKSL